MPILGPVEYLEGVLGLDLFPGQRLALKMMYGERFSPTPYIQVRDQYGQEVVDTLSEEHYLEYLHDRGRASTDTQTSLGFSTAVFCMGRRAGRTQLTTYKHLYDIYRFSEMPEEDIPDRNRTFTCLIVEPNTSLARTSHRALRDLLTEYMHLQRESSEALWINLANERQVRFEFRGGSNPTLRGVRCATITLGNAAFLPNLVERMQALTPCLGPNSQLVLESSPNGQNNEFHQFFRMAMNLPTYITLRLPSWEANPTLPAELFRSARANFPSIFASYFAADFVDVTSERRQIDVLTDMANMWQPTAESEPVAPEEPAQSRFELLGEDLSD